MCIYISGAYAVPVHVREAQPSWLLSVLRYCGTVCPHYGGGGDVCTALCLPHMGTRTGHQYVHLSGEKLFLFCVVFCRPWRLYVRVVGMCWPCGCCCFQPNESGRKLFPDTWSWTYHFYSIILMGLGNSGAQLLLSRRCCRLTNLQVTQLHS